MRQVLVSKVYLKVFMDFHLRVRKWQSRWLSGSGPFSSMP